MGPFHEVIYFNKKLIVQICHCGGADMLSLN